MRHRPTWAPDEIDIERPAAARMVDCLPGAAHDGAHGPNPAARTVYVGADPVALAHSTALPDGTDHAAIVHGEPREAEAVLREPVVNCFLGPVVDGLLDLGRPVAALMVAVSHPVSAEADGLAVVVAASRAATAPGSSRASSHATGHYRPEGTGPAGEIRTRTSHRMTFRDQAEILALMPGYELVPPGLVDPIRRRPDARDDTRPDPLGGGPARRPRSAAVGRRP